MQITDYKKVTQKSMSAKELIEEYEKGSRDFSNVTFETGMDLGGANLEHAIFSGAHLLKANLSGAKLYEANFSGADLYRALLIKARLDKANFSGANLQYVDFSNVISLNGANFRGADFSYANLIKAADLEHAVNIEYAVFEHTCVTFDQKNIIMDAKINPKAVRKLFNINGPYTRIPLRE